MQPPKRCDHKLRHEGLGKSAGLAWGKEHHEYGFWHEPFPRKPPTLRAQYDWFMVVRNPITRAVSEYNYMMQRFRGPANVSRFRVELQLEIEKMLRQRRLDPKRGHLVPQHAYLLPPPRLHEAATTASSTKTPVVYVLRYERLAAEFNSLMRGFGIENASLSASRRINRSPRWYYSRDVDDQLADVLRSAYSEDCGRLHPVRLRA